MGIQFCGEAEAVVVLREGEVGVPVCGYDGIALYVYGFGFGFLADGGAGGAVFSFLEGTGHVLEGFGCCRVRGEAVGVEFGSCEIWIRYG